MAVTAVLGSIRQALMVMKMVVLAITVGMVYMLPAKNALKLIQIRTIKGGIYGFSPYNVQALALSVRK